MDVEKIKSSLILPGTVLVFVPVLVLWASSSTSYAAHFPSDSFLTWLMGPLFAASGLALMIWTTIVLNPKTDEDDERAWKPKQRFITTGPYRFVRNPLMLGMVLFLTAEAMLLQSFPILIWMMAFLFMNTVYNILVEEPAMERRFGEAYVIYKHNVPRWVPRFSGYDMKVKV